MPWPVYDPRKQVGDDIFSMLAFLSPRQGPNDSTVQPPPEPPTAPPATAPEPALPNPVATRKLPPQIGPAPPPPVLAGSEGTPSLVGGAGTDTLDPKPVVPPVSAPPPPVSDAGGLAVRPGSPVPGGVNPLPALPDPGAGLDSVMQIYQQQMEQRRRAAIGNAIGDAALMIGSATTRSPSARAALSGMVSNGSGGSRSGDASITDLLNIQKISAAAMQAKADNALIPALAARSGESEAVLRSMSADDRGKYMAKITSGENIAKVDRGDGSVAFVEERTGRVISTIGADAYKQAQEADRRAKEKREADLHPGVLERQGVDIATERGKESRAVQAFPTEQKQREQTLATGAAEEARKAELQPGVMTRQAADTAATLGQEQRAAEKAAQEATALNQRLGNLDAVMERNPGMSRATAEALARQGGDGWGKLVSPDWEVKTNDNGDTFAYDKHNPNAKPIPLFGDPTKAAAAAAELASKQASTTKTGLENVGLADKNIKDAELRKLMSDETSRNRLAAELQMTPDELHTAWLSGAADDVIKQRINATPLYQEWLRTDQKKTFTQWAEDDRASKMQVASPGRVLQEGFAKETAEKSEAANKAMTAMPDIHKRFQQLQNDDIYTGAIKGTKAYQKAKGIMSEIMNTDTTKLENTQEYVNTTLSSSISKAKELGFNPTNSDLELTRQANGSDLSQTRNALIFNQQFQARTLMRQALAADKQVRDAIEVFQDDPKSTAILKTKLRELPDYTETMFPKARIDYVDAALKSDMSEAAKQKIIQDLDTDFGQGLGAYYMAKRGPRGTSR